MRSTCLEPLREFYALAPWPSVSGAVAALRPYRLRFEEWPRQAHLHPGWLWGLAQILDGSDFERLATRLELTTLADDDPNRPFVSGDARRVGADELVPRMSSREELEKWSELLEEARDWLAVG